jgi:plasmid stabilization system protein ParE
MAFKILYHEDALADLEEIFEWSREKHPETTEQFANDLFDHIDPLRAFPYIGAPIKGNP